DRELAVGDERGAGVDPLAHREAAQPPGDDTDPSLPMSVATIAMATIQPRSLQRERSIVSANAKKNNAAKMSRIAKNRCSISSRTPLSDRITPAISAPIASESSSSIAIALIAITKPKTARRKNSS